MPRARDQCLVGFFDCYVRAGRCEAFGRFALKSMVEIRYKLRQSADEASLRLADEDYFDPLDPGESWSRDGIPRFSRLSKYLSDDEASIEWAHVALADDSGTEERLERYSPDGRVWMWQRTDPDGGGEVCVETHLDSSHVHLARFNLDAGGSWGPNYIGVFTDLPDGSQIEDKIVPPIARPNSPHAP
jgi:hypothetical protein